MKEVYIAKHLDEIVYIGQGSIGRHKHCNSGISHVYELNKLHFDGVMLDVQVVKLVDTVEDALQLETSLIVEHKPKYNVRFNYVSNDKETITRYMKKLSHAVKVFYALTNKRKYALEYLCKAEEFIRHFGFQNLKCGVNLDAKLFRKQYHWWHIVLNNKGSTYMFKATGIWLYFEMSETNVKLKLIDL